MGNFKDNKIDSVQIGIKQIFESRSILYIISLIFIFFMLLAISYSTYNYNYFRDPPFFFTLRPGNSLEQTMYTWEEYNLGANNLWGIQKVPLLLAFVLIRNVFDLSTFTFLFNFISLFIGFLGMFIFSKIFIFSELGTKQKNVFALISSFLYIFNPFTAITIIAGIFLLIPYIFIPWFIILGYKSIFSGRWLIIYVVLSSFVVSSFFNPATIIIANFINIVFLLFLFIIYKLSYKILIKKILLFGIIFIFLTSYWNFPLILSYLNKSPSELELGREMFHSLNSNILEVVKLTNEWQFYGNYNGFYMFVFSEFFKDSAYILFLFSILSLISLILIVNLSKYQKRLTIFIFILFVIGLILAQGYHKESPIRDVYISLMEKGYFGFFRDNYKFDAIIAFSYSLLIPLSLLAIGNLKLKRKNYLLYSTYFLLIILMIFSSYPFWGGKLFDRYYDKIPSDVTNVSEELNNATIDGRILILPASYMPAYNWLHPFIKRPIWYATLDTPMINRYGGDFSPNPITRIFLEDIYSELLTYYPDDILSFLRVKKIIIDKNVDTEFFGTVQPTKKFKKINKWLEKSQQIKIEEDYGSVSIYSFNGDIIPLFFIENINNYTSNNYTSQRDVLTFKDNISSCWNQDDKSSSKILRYDKIQMNFILNKKGGICIIHKKFAKPIDISKFPTFVLDIEYENEYDIAPIILLKNVDDKWTEPIIIGTINNIGQTRINYTFPLSSLYDKNINQIEELQIGIYAKETNESRYPLIDNIIFSNIHFLEKERYDFNLLTKNLSLNYTKINYTKINPSLYKTEINTTKPFILSFAESYDPLWTVKIDKINRKDIKSDFIRPIPLYHVMNSFLINQTGNLDITIEYEPQRWFYIGTIISMITLIISVSYLIYDWRINKKRINKKGVILEHKK